MNLEFEKAILGSVLLDETCLRTVLSIIDSDAFQDKRHNHLFRLFVKMQFDKKPIDLLSVTDQLKKAGLYDRYGSAYLTDLANYVPTSGNIRYYCEELNKDHKRTQLRSLTQSVSTLIEKSESPDKIIGQAMIELLKLKTKEAETNTALQLANQVHEHLKLSINDPERLKGITTGFHTLDDLIGGYRKGEFITVSGFPSRGKTALTIGSAYRQAKAGKRVYYLSLEMGKQKIGRRLVSLATRTPEILELNQAKLDRIADRILDVDVPLIIDTRSRITADEFFAACATAKAEHNCDIIYVDYLQKVKVKAETREMEVSTVSDLMTIVAKELDLPVVGISVLSKDGSSRYSGMIDFDADVQLAIDRKEDNPTLAEIIVRKNRDYKTGACELNFAPAFAAFYDPGEELEQVVINEAPF